MSNQSVHGVGHSTVQRTSRAPHPSTSSRRRALSDENLDALLDSAMEDFNGGGGCGGAAAVTVDSTDAILAGAVEALLDGGDSAAAETVDNRAIEGVSGGGGGGAAAVTVDPVIPQPLEWIAPFVNSMDSLIASLIPDYNTIKDTPLIKSLIDTLKTGLKKLADDPQNFDKNLETFKTRLLELSNGIPLAISFLKFTNPSLAQKLASFDAKNLVYHLYFGLKFLHFIYAIPELHQIPIKMTDTTTRYLDLPEPISVANLTLALLVSGDSDNRLTKINKFFLNILNPKLMDTLRREASEDEYQTLIRFTREFLEDYHIPLALEHWQKHPHIQSNPRRIDVIQDAIQNCRINPDSKKTDVEKTDVEKNSGVQLILSVFGMDPSSPELQAQIQRFVVPQVFENLPRYLQSQPDPSNPSSLLKSRPIEAAICELTAKLGREISIEAYLSQYLKTVLMYMQTRRHFIEKFPNTHVSRPLHYAFFTLLDPHVKDLIEWGLSGAPSSKPIFLYEFFIKETNRKLQESDPSIGLPEAYKLQSNPKVRALLKKLPPDNPKSAPIRSKFSQFDTNISHIYPLLSPELREHIEDGSAQGMILAIFHIAMEWQQIGIPADMATPKHIFLNLLRSYSQIKIPNYKPRRSELFAWCKVNAQNTQQRFLTERFEGMAAEGRAEAANTHQEALNYYKLIIVLINILWDDMGEDLGEVDILDAMYLYFDRELDRIIKPELETIDLSEFQKRKEGYAAYLDLLIHSTQSLIEYLRDKLRINPEQLKQFRQDYVGVINAMRLSWLVNQSGANIRPYLGRTPQMWFSCNMNMNAFYTLDQLLFEHLGGRLETNDSPHPSDLSDCVPYYPLTGMRKVAIAESLEQSCTSGVLVTAKAVLGSIPESPYPSSQSNAQISGDTSSLEARISQDPISIHQHYRIRLVSLTQVIGQLGNDVSTFFRELTDADFCNVVISTLLHYMPERSHHFLKLLTQIKAAGFELSDLKLKDLGAPSKNALLVAKIQEKIAYTAAAADIKIKPFVQELSARYEITETKVAEEIRIAVIQKILEYIHLCHIESLVVLNVTEYLKELSQLARMFQDSFEESHQVATHYRESAILLFLTYWIIRGDS